MEDLSAARILAGLEGTRFRQVEVHPTLPSTQTLLGREGGPDGRVVVADHQTAGRGRAGREWLALPGRSLAASSVLRGISMEASPLVTLAAAVAVAVGIERTSGLQPGLKWPNDVLVGDRKAAGILGELAAGGAYIVLGIGVNVGHTAEELPAELGATSLRASGGAHVPRDELLVAILRAFEETWSRDGWIDEYRRRCVTVGSRVRVELPERRLEGRADAVGDDGALVVDGAPVFVGDVVHIRADG